MEHKRELKRVAFNPQLWKLLNDGDQQQLIELCDQQLNSYFERRVEA